MADTKKPKPPDPSCPLCNGDPKSLGGIHVGKADPDTGEVTCPGCGGAAERRKGT